MYLWTKRKHERHTVVVQVGVAGGVKSPNNGRILSTYDISIEGAFIVTDTPLDVGKKVLLRIILPSGSRTIMPGIIWRTTAQGMAVRFDHCSEEIMNEFGNGERNSETLRLTKATRERIILSIEL